MCIAVVQYTHTLLYFLIKINNLARRFTRSVKKGPEFRTNRQIRIPKIRLVGNNLDEVSEAAGKTIED